MSSENADTWRSSSYFNELQKKDKAKYKRKLTLTNGQLLPDLYGIAENMKSDMKLMPNACWGDMYNYLVNPPNEYSYGNVKAWKLSIFLCGTMFKTFIKMKLQKNVAISKQRYKNIYLSIFIKSLF